MTVHPPAHVERYVEILGEDLAITFLLALGGAELQLGANPRADGKVADLVGLAAAQRLAAAHLPRRVPVAKQWIARVWAEKGLPTAEIARRLHMTDVAVRRWLGGAKPGRKPRPTDERQFPLL